MSLEAYDFATPLPSAYSRRVMIRPTSSSTSFNIHIACVPHHASSNNPRSQYTFDAVPSFSSNSSKLPTVLYEPPSGVPGSLSLLNAPLPPSGESAHLPGKWLFDLQAQGRVGTVCVWDRPGYGHSEVATDSEIGAVTDALWLGLDTVLGKTQIEQGFVLVGEGYGG